MCTGKIDVMRQIQGNEFASELNNLHYNYIYILYVQLFKYINGHNCVDGNYDINCIFYE
jgi:hypothetical protein